jgi:hypothetical protein
MRDVEWEDVRSEEKRRRGEEESPRKRSTRIVVGMEVI